METKRFRRVFLVSLMLMMGATLYAQGIKQLTSRDGRISAWATTCNEVSPSKVHKQSGELVHVTCKLNYDKEKYQPGRDISAFDINTIDGKRVPIEEMNETNDSFEGDLPVGVYDLVWSFSTNDYQTDLIIIKEEQEITKDMTIVFDAEEATNLIQIDAYNPEGELFKPRKYEWGENGPEEIESGNFDEAMGNIKITRKEDLCIVCEFFADYFGGFGKRYVNDLSDRFIFTECRIYFDWIMQDEEKDCLYVNKFFTDDVKKKMTNKVDDYVYIEEPFESSCFGADSEKSNTVKIQQLYNGWRIGGMTTFLGLGNVSKLYVNAPLEKQDSPNRYDLLVRPSIGDYFYQDRRQWKGMYGLPIVFEAGEKRYLNTGSVWDIGTEFSFFGAVHNGKIGQILYPENKAFSYSEKQKILNYGTGCPINYLFPGLQYVDYVEGYEGIYPTGINCYYIGRYGEMRETDQMALKMSMKLNGEEICNNYQRFSSSLMPWINPDRELGVVDMTFDNQNVLVDGLQGKNLTTVHIDQTIEDNTSPTLTMLWFKDKEDRIIDRFPTADDGTLEFSGGDFNFSYNPAYSTVYGLYDCAEQTVEVAYSPYGKDCWSELAVEEIPENFFMPGFGYFYRGSLKDVTGVGEKGWFDLKIRLDDKSGNWQEQVVSPAFRIDDLVDTGIADEGLRMKDEGVKAGAVYDVMGRRVANAQSSMVNGQSNKGIRIVRKRNGDVRKVVVR